MMRYLYLLAIVALFGACGSEEKNVFCSCVKFATEKYSVGGWDELIIGIDSNLRCANIFDSTEKVIEKLVQESDVPDLLLSEASESELTQMAKYMSKKLKCDEYENLFYIIAENNMPNLELIYCKDERKSELTKNMFERFLEEAEDEMEKEMRNKP
ncbi:hypothetical protein OAW23_10440 [Flavobacteriales bacterium]|nr:hypothetical protein [Flavobacteriales bacterium]